MLGDAEISHRGRILASIRMSLGESAEPTAIAAEYEAIPRSYVQPAGLMAGLVDELGDGHADGLKWDAVIAQFEERLLEYDAGVYRTDVGGIAETVREVLTARGKTGLVVPVGVSPLWLPDGLDFELADAVDIGQLDRSQGVLTACTVAIAETGSIVLQNAAGQGARALSLVPDYHLCVVFAAQIAGSVPEAFQRLETTSTLPTTFISGPSATADIEMTRIKGVHGPRFLDVLIVV